MTAAHLTSIVLTTGNILTGTAEHPLHLRLRKDLDPQPVSSKSIWSDRRWVFDNTTHGAGESASTINWDLELSDGRNLLDPYHADLLDWLRRLVWSTFAAPGGGAGVLKPGTLGSISAGLRYWTTWLVDQHIAWPSEITEDVIYAYITHLRQETEDDADTPTLTTAVATRRLMPFALLWRQRNALERAGIAPMPTPPFQRGTLEGVVKEIAAVAVGSFRPLPNEVALPVLNTAMSLLGAPAQDVIALMQACDAAYASGLMESLGRRRQIKLAKQRQAEAARAFRFAEIDGIPWHPLLDPADWKESKVSGIARNLESYLKARRTEWMAQPISSRQPTLPMTHRYGYGECVDLRRVVLALGEAAGDEQYLTQHAQLYRLLDEAVREQGLRPIPFVTTMKRARQLVLAVRSAAHIVIQATSGMRISEICGLRAGLDPETGLPLSVKVRDSISGLGEVFVLTSDLSKTEETPRAVEWTVGYRPKGSAQLPPTVQAIIVLDHLLAPYRHLIGTDDLFIKYNTLGEQKINSEISRITGIQLLLDAKEFIAEWVDLTGLPDEAACKTMDKELVPYRESHGRIVKTHQLRKTFANFVYQVDQSLLPVLQMHYHHVSIAMTDGGYLNNPILLRDQNDVRYQKTALLSMEIADGGTRIAGRYGEELERKIASELGPRIEGLAAGDAYREAYLYVGEAALDRLFFEPHGICGARGASQMACHREAGTADLARWSHRLTPNYSTRTPALCAGCESFIIAKWHLPFWKQRYIDYMTEIRQLKAFGMVGLDLANANALTLARARQAQALCRHLEADMDDLERCVEIRVEEMRHATEKINRA